jgi:hypothetical protein
VQVILINEIPERLRDIQKRKENEARKCDYRIEKIVEEMKG